METRKAFLLYVDDWLSSASIEGMTPAEEGAYLRLLCRAWQQPDCGLPNDDEALARLSRLGDGWLDGAGAKIRACFFERDGRLYNVRLLRERKNQDAYRSRISKVRADAARQRWERHGPSFEQLQSKCIANAMQPKHKPKPKQNNNSSSEPPGWPATEAAVRAFFPGATERFIADLADKALAAAPGAADEDIARAVYAAHRGGKQRSAGLFLRTVPEFLANGSVPFERRLTSVLASVGTAG